MHKCSFQLSMQLITYSFFFLRQKYAWDWSHNSIWYTSKDRKRSRDYRHRKVYEIRASAKEGPMLSTLNYDNLFLYNIMSFLK